MAMRLQLLHEAPFSLPYPTLSRQLISSGMLCFCCGFYQVFFQVFFPLFFGARLFPRCLFNALDPFAPLLSYCFLPVDYLGYRPFCCTCPVMCLVLI